MVIAILATVSLALLNPLEQFAKGNDAARKNKVNQLGRGVEAYSVDTGVFPTAAGTWMQSLVNIGLFKSLIPATAGNRACVGNIVNGFCYSGGGGAQTYIYTFVESSSEAKKCSTGVGGASSTVYYVYDTGLRRTCIKCSSTYTGACNAVQ